MEWCIKIDIKALALVGVGINSFRALKRVQSSSFVYSMGIYRINGISPAHLKMLSVVPLLLVGTGMAVLLQIAPDLAVEISLHKNPNKLT